jgi:hypothetical protein
VASIGVRMSGDKKIRLDLSQQLDHVRTPCDQSPRLKNVFKLEHSPINLVNPWGMTLKPIVKSDIASH